MLGLGIRKPHPSDLLVLAGEDDLAAVPVEGGGEDELRQAKVDKTLSCANVPDADVVVRATGQEDVLCGWVPHHDADSSLVEVKVHDAVGHGPGDAAVGDLPHLDCAVLRGRGDDIVIVRTPGDVQHWALMTSHQGYIRGHSPSLNSKLTLKDFNLNAEFKFEENVPWQVGGQGRHLLRQIQQSLQEIKV